MDVTARLPRWFTPARLVTGVVVICDDSVVVFLIHVNGGLGLPLATHVKLTVPPSFTRTLEGGVRIAGGSTNR